MEVSHSMLFIYRLIELQNLFCKNIDARPRSLLYCINEHLALLSSENNRPCCAFGAIKNCGKSLVFDFSFFNLLYVSQCRKDT